MFERPAYRKFSQSATKLALIAAIAVFLPSMQGRTNNFDDRLLASHNRERSVMGVAALKWNQNLARDAQEWADHLAANTLFQHSPNTPGSPQHGENIWGGTRDAFPPEAMVGLWVSEKAKFVRGVFPSNSATGQVQDVSHYTQLVWKQTREVGCGLGRNENEEILVCRYSKAGNIIGRRPL